MDIEIPNNVKVNQRLLDEALKGHPYEIVQLSRAESQCPGAKDSLGKCLVTEEIKYYPTIIRVPNGSAGVIRVKLKDYNPEKTDSEERIHNSDIEVLKRRVEALEEQIKALAQK